jgi:hypothetical protein
LSKRVDGEVDTIVPSRYSYPAILIRGGAAMLFQARDGAYYSFKDVRCARPDWGSKTVAVELQDRSVTVDWYMWEDHIQDRTIMSISPALPGYSLLTPVLRDDDEVEYDKEPVIAWALTLRGTVVAVSVDGLDEMNRAVLLPDGAVMEPQSASYRDLDTYLSSKRAETRIAAE